MFVESRNDQKSDLIIKVLPDKMCQIVSFCIFAVRKNQEYDIYATINC